jgi:hypothetical protein
MSLFHEDTSWGFMQNTVVRNHKKVLLRNEVCIAYDDNLTMSFLSSGERILKQWLSCKQGLLCRNSSFHVLWAEKRLQDE